MAEADDSAAAGPEEPVSVDEPESRFVDAKVALERIRDLTTTARTTWLVLIGFLAFIGLTLLSVRDVDFFSVTATTDLPIVNIAIPTTTFFWTAAVLAAVLHTYFHVFLLQLWDALAEAPPEIDKLTLGDRVFPWLVNQWALRQRKDRPVTRRPMGLLGSAVTGLVIWLATPIVLAGFWWLSLPAHDARVSLAIAAALWLSLFASMRGWRRARRRLAQPGLISKREQHRTTRQLFGVARRGLVTTLLWLLMLAAVPVLFDVTIAGAGSHHLRAVVTQSLSANWLAGEDGIPFAGADLVDAEIAIEPGDWRDPEIARRRFHADWCRDNGLPVAACERSASGETNVARADACRAKGIAFADCAAHFAGIDAGFEDKWRIERRAGIGNIRGPDLRGRDLRNAAASGAFLAGVDLRDARLEGAFLYRARLEGANLFEARLEGANLRKAGLEGAFLYRARLEGANLRGARLEGGTSARRGWRGRTSARRGWRVRSSSRRGWRGRTSAERDWRGRTSTRRVWRVRTSSRRGWRVRTSAGRGWRVRTSARRGWRGWTSSRRGWRVRTSVRRVWRRRTSAERD